MDSHSYLFDEQVISYSTQSREHSHSLIIAAIKRAVQSCSAALVAKSKLSQSNADRIHESGEDDGVKASEHPEQEIRAALLSNFHSAKAAHSCFSRDGAIGKKEWRKIIRKTLPEASKQEAKVLSKALPKLANVAQFSAWMGEAESTPSLEKVGSKSESPGLASLPIEVPVLPASFQSRPFSQEQLILALLDSGGNHSTAVTAPKSRVSVIITAAQVFI